MKTNVLIRLAAVVVIAFALFLMPRLWGWTGLPFAILGGLLLMTYFLVIWHARHTGYQCPECSHTFAISAETDFLSPHLGGVKMLSCPKCGRSSWCPEIPYRDVVDTPPMEIALPIVDTPGGTSLRLQIIVIALIYGALWVYSLTLWPSLPDHASLWTLLKIPLATLILPVLQVVFCRYALRQGYRSRIYLFVTLFVGIFLLLAIWMQRNIAAQFS